MKNREKTTMVGGKGQTSRRARRRRAQDGDVSVSGRLDTYQTLHLLLVEGSHGLGLGHCTTGGLGTKVRGRRYKRQLVTVSRDSGRPLWPAAMRIAGIRLCGRSTSVFHHRGCGTHIGMTANWGREPGEGREKTAKRRKNKRRRSRGGTRDQDSNGGDLAQGERA